jgi:hypothetical protein
MKALKFSFLFSVIIFAISFSLVGCDPINPPDPPIDPPITKVDSVIMKITLVLPAGVVIRNSTLSIANPVLPEGAFYKWFGTNDRNFDFTFVKEAKALIGTNCTITFSIMQGIINGSTATFELVGNNTFLIQKGLNQYTVTYNAKKY